ncbi:MAG TPA: adenylate/guanylate cyclase domain-containing protein [Ignavibacteria bacterium]|nr:adenylate/guanylate cyclase domain-containing protein [Ignavibacteria bacterium]
MNADGNITFLFTDIEGSTKLSQEFPEKLSSALEKHDKILRNAVESYNGFVFKIVGDAFCCAFENADDAVKAAVLAQTELRNEKWDEQNKKDSLFVMLQEQLRKDEFEHYREEGRKMTLVEAIELAVGI